MVRTLFDECSLVGLCGTFHMINYTNHASVLKLDINPKAFPLINQRS